ncbi:MAG: hypothetical protein KDD29_06890 [Flavobacteriales bacterium]|nr:hypothetical protein [Flavobacteriales bacterium]
MDIKFLLVAFAAGWIGSVVSHFIVGVAMSDSAIKINETGNPRKDSIKSSPSISPVSSIVGIFVFSVIVGYLIFFFEKPEFVDLSKYKIGLNLTFDICRFSGLLFCYLFITRAIAGSFGQKIIGLIGGLLLMCFLCFSLFALVYPILNLAFQTENLNVAFFKEELSLGIIGIRISSLILAVRCLINFVKLFSIIQKVEFKALKTKYEFEEFIKLKSKLEDSSLIIKSLVQYSFYLIVIISLWVFTISNKNSLSIQVLSWGLFFIIDDWNIIAAYYEQLKGRILRFQKWKIVFFDILLSILLFYSAWDFFSMDWLIIVITVVTLMLLAKYFDPKILYFDRIN